MAHRLRLLLAGLVVAVSGWPAQAALIINLRFEDGTTTKKLTSASVNAEIPIEVWASITNVGGTNGSGTHEGLQYVFYSLQSQRLVAGSSGSIEGELASPDIPYPFAAAGSQFGALADFSSDGIGDLGSAATSSSNANYAKPRAGGATFDDDFATGQAITNGFEFLVETVNFHVHSFPASTAAGGGTRFNPLITPFDNVATANWWQDASKSPLNDGINNSDNAMSAGTSVNFLFDTPWQNIGDPLNVDGINGVQPLDVLLIINDLNANGPHTLGPPSGGQPPPYLDVDGNNFVSPLDALLVINELNSQTFSLVGQSLLVSMVPEPSSAMLALCGLLGLGAFAARRALVRRR